MVDTYPVEVNKLTGKLSLLEIEPLSGVSQTMKVSVTPSDGIVQIEVPTATIFFVGSRLCPMALM